MKKKFLSNGMLLKTPLYFRGLVDGKSLGAFFIFIPNPGLDYSLHERVADELKMKIDSNPGLLEENKHAPSFPLGDTKNFVGYHPSNPNWIIRYDGKVCDFKMQVLKK